MEIATHAAAAQLGVSQRQVQRLARSGRVVHRAIAGRTVVAGRSLVALSRSAGRGRRWDEQTVAAACDLLDHGSTERISGSQRSRLRARLRGIPIADLAYHVLGDRVSLWRTAGPDAGAPDQLTEALSSTGERLTVTVTPDAAVMARRSRLLEDADGAIVLVELDTDSPAVVVDVARYAYGDERTSGAARRRIEARQAGLS